MHLSARRRGADRHAASPTNAGTLDGKEGGGGGGGLSKGTEVCWAMFSFFFFFFFFFYPSPPSRRRSFNRAGRFGYRRRFFSEPTRRLSPRLGVSGGRGGGIR